MNGPLPSPGAVEQETFPAGAVSQTHVEALLHEVKIAVLWPVLHVEQQLTGGASDLLEQPEPPHLDTGQASQMVTATGM